MIFSPVEGRPKGSIEYGVDDGVDRRRYVSQPESDVDYVVRHVVAVRSRAEHEEYIQQEERRPAQHEGEKHQAEHLTRLLLGTHDVGHSGHILSLVPVSQESEIMV